MINFKRPQHFLVWLGFFALIIISFGCNRKTESVKAIVVPDSVVTQNAQPTPRRDPVFDERYLQRQAIRSNDARKTIDSLKAIKPVNSEQLRDVILRRKGEIIFAVKDIRKSQFLSQSARDSLSSPLDAEAIDLAEELLDLEQKNPK